MNNPRSELLSRRPRTGTPVKDEALFLAHLEVIDSAIKTVCRRYRLASPEADDFAASVRLRLFERPDPLLKFEGRSRIETYLVVVVTRLFLDYCNAQWGKWRPSAEARRLGSTAMLVERLVVRDSYTFDQIVDTLRTNHGITMTPELLAFHAKITSRAPSRQFVSDVEAAAVDSGGPAASVNVVIAEQEFLAKRVRAALDKVLQRITAEERTILRLRYCDGMTIVGIARALNKDEKPFFRAMDRLHAAIGAGLLAEGIRPEDVHELIESGALGDLIDDEPQGGRGAAAFTEGARTPWRKR
jgi:RNA polymerase sigma factor (sigma-70 family)